MNRWNLLYYEPLCSLNRRFLHAASCVIQVILWQIQAQIVFELYFQIWVILYKLGSFI